MKKKIQKEVKTFKKRPKRLDRAHTKQQITADKTILLIERRYQVITMRKDGYSLEAIAKAQNVSVNVVREDIQTVLDNAIKHTNETVEEHRQLQLMRLDQLLVTYTRFANEWHKESKIDPFTNLEVIVEVPPNPKYADLILAVEARRSKLLALDMPEVKKLEVSGIREYVGIDVDEV